MQLQMQNAEALPPEQISEFLKASDGIEFSGHNSKKQRGRIRAYIAKVSGLSLPQVTRLIRMYRATGRVEAAVYQRCRFPRKYTARMWGCWLRWIGRTSG